jgi:hypothetical protein
MVQGGAGRRHGSLKTHMNTPKNMLLVVWGSSDFSRNE